MCKNVEEQFQICEYCKHGVIKGVYSESIDYCTKKLKEVCHNNICKKYKPNKQKINNEVCKENMYWY